jgi:predicted MFS family arabinose efflux permease
VSSNRLRRARIAVAVVFFITGSTFATWAARVPAIKAGLGLSTSELAVALGGLNGGAFLALPVAGGVVRSLGSRTVLGASLGVYLAALPLLAIAPGVIPLTCALFLLATGNTGVDVAMNTQGALVTRCYGRPILGGLHAMFSVGGLAGAAAGSLFATAGVSVLTNFTLVAIVLAVAGAAAATALLPDPPAGGGGFRLALPGRHLLVLGLIAFCVLMTEGVVNDWSAVYMREASGAGPGLAAIAFAAFSLGMVAGRLLADRVHSVLEPPVVIACCGTVAGLAALLTVLVPVPTVGLVGYAVIGLGVAGIVPVVFSHAARSNPEHAGPAIAGVSTIGYLGFLAGPAVIGGLAGLTSLRAAMVVLPVLMIVMIALSRRVP